MSNFYPDNCHRSGVCKSEIARLRTDLAAARAEIEKSAPSGLYLKVLEERDAALAELAKLPKKGGLIDAIDLLFAERQGHCPSGLYEDGFSDACAAAKTAIGRLFDA
jgi:hypothetical protein